MQGEIEKLRTEMEVSAAVLSGLGDPVSLECLMSHSKPESQGWIPVHQDGGGCCTQLPLLILTRGPTLRSCALTWSWALRCES